MDVVENSKPQEKIREEIVEAAKLVFEKKGYSKVSMKDISEICHKGRSTLYYYFKNKKEVFEAVAIEIMNTMFVVCNKAITTNQSFASNIESFHKKKITYLRSTIRKYHLLFDDLRRENMIYSTLNTVISHQNEIKGIKIIVRYGIENKDILAMNEEDIDFLAETISTAFKSIDVEILIHDRMALFEEKMAWLAKILQKGLS